MESGEARVGAEALRELCSAVFERCGMDPDDAYLLADTLVEADLGGVHSHGVLRVPEYVQKLTVRGVDPRGRPRVVRDAGSCLVVDGGNSMGQIGAHFAMRQVIERAENTGVAAAAARGSNHCGAMAYYSSMALCHDMVGMATTNALPTMAPFGGAQRILGINPVSFAIPAEEEPPVVYDAAFAGSSHGKIRIHRQQGRQLPVDWALDHRGRPTTDPEVAIDGLLRPIGGFKGVGLALVMGILSSMLSGAAYGTELGDMEQGPTPGIDGHFFLALRISAFEDVGRFKARVDAAIRQIHGSQRAPGRDRIYVPGEKEFLNRQAYLHDGIPLNAEELADLRQVSEHLGVDASALPV